MTTSPSPATPDAKPFKVGFIGAGGISGAHATWYKKIPGVELVAAADISEKSLATMKEKWGVKTYTDYKEMLAKEKDLDAVSVCTPNGLHAQNSIDALNAGKHVIVEKPMAMNAKEGQLMIDAAKKAKKHLVVGFQYRFDGKTAVIKRQIDDGVFGKILYVRCQALRRRGIPNWGVFGRKDLQGGGPMIDIGVHVMEMAHYTMGSPKPITASGNVWTYLGNKPMEALTGWANWDHKTYTVEDLAIGQIRFDNGALLSIEASFAAHIEKDMFTFTVMGEKGGACWDPCAIYKDEHGYMFNETPHYIGGGDQWEHKMRHFVEVCRDGKPNLSSGEAGLMVQKMLDGVYASAEAKKEVRID
ncbi:MAG: Gfo/Idh/MocA family oxidoreductase [Planctomycetes bacterium]|nr:Gfo/Idh/MocA family oxidoreductase [Planctomycetota bacterium]